MLYWQCNRKHFTVGATAFSMCAQLGSSGQVTISHVGCNLIQLSSADTARDHGYYKLHLNVRPHGTEK